MPTVIGIVAAVVIAGGLVLFWAFGLAPRTMLPILAPADANVFVDGKLVLKCKHEARRPRQRQQKECDPWRSEGERLYGWLVPRGETLEIVAQADSDEARGQVTIVDEGPQPRFVIKRKGGKLVVREGPKQVPQ